MLKVEVHSKYGVSNITINKTKEQFLDMFAYDEGDMYVTTEDGFYIMVKTIEGFRFKEADSEGRSTSGTSN
jgi:hypothetical protein